MKYKIQSEIMFVKEYIKQTVLLKERCNGRFKFIKIRYFKTLIFICQYSVFVIFKETFVKEYIKLIVLLKENCSRKFLL